MKILLADKLPASGLTVLENAGHEAISSPDLTGEQLEVALQTLQPQVLVVRSTKVTVPMMDGCPSLELIVRAGAGYDTIDVAGASARGIFVANCPGKNAVAVAELTIGLLLALDRKIPDAVGEARQGNWNKALFSKAAGLKGKTLGIVGVGSIAEAVIARAKALEMKVVAWSRSLTGERAHELGIQVLPSPVAVAKVADAVSLHVASTPETKHLANRTFFEAMKEGAFFINTTRGAVVDEEALQWALETKGIWAGLDVFDDEPSAKVAAFEKALVKHPQVYLTHHIGASTQQAQDATAAEAARIINTYAAKGHVPNCVNMEVHSPATHLLTVRHLDKVGVLAAVLDEMRKADWNVQEMENLVFEGAKAACARIRFAGSPNEEIPQRISDHPDVLAVSLIAL